MKFLQDSTDYRGKTKRPRGSVPPSDMYNEFYNQALLLKNELVKYQEVIGITIGGGLSRGYADDLSEIDLNIYLKENAVEKWSSGNGPYPQGDFLLGSYHMDFSFLSLEKEQKENWDLTKKWDASYQIIIYDRDDQIKQLLKKKSMFTLEEKFQLALASYLDCVYLGDIVVEQWIKREDPFSAHLMINQAIPSLIKLLFLANDEFPPYIKWLLNYSYSLVWSPPNWKRRLENVIYIKELSFVEVERRKKQFKTLYQEIWGKLVGDEFKEDGLLEIKELEKLNYIIKKKPTLENFKKKYGLKSLSSELLYKLTKVKKHDGEEIIEFDRIEFEKAKKDKFANFLDWNKKILKKIE